ncbi:arginyltransferase [Alkalimonas collagenimarina]|uniref:Aspartate/glutamate leucyltransferase n=1 Tax=Alkalimonas collagenimarina TaxID=400390 RepID=A0ABT9GWE9_9GAMM|nr:arginyltransferase [Alkalimonas collagenimarina]MDP4535382.1 arginyltransferase [Alkalimonas collagenimarina]
MNELRFGLTAAEPCAYLPEQNEQVIFLLPEQPLHHSLYQQLLQHNFRRSGDDVYRPHCSGCQQCQSVRLPVHTFTPSRRQRRILAKANRQGFRVQWQPARSASDYFALYQDYIDFKHQEGSMYPASIAQLESLLTCNWMPVWTLELYDQQQLVAVSVVDKLDNSLSAVYTFYHPKWQQFSPGLLAILLLIEQAKCLQSDFLYLGYYIADCEKMAYKGEFRPQQRFIDGKWHSIR